MNTCKSVRGESGFICKCKKYYKKIEYLNNTQISDFSNFDVTYTIENCQGNRLSINFYYNYFSTTEKNHCIDDDEANRCGKHDSVKCIAHEIDSLLINGLTFDQLNTDHLYNCSCKTDGHSYNQITKQCARKKFNCHL